jgi:phytanoyl-CoA hydroxylase
VTIKQTDFALMDSQGFCVLENVFTDADMDILASAIERYHRRHQDEIDRQGGVSGISRASEITFTSHLAEQDAEIMAFCRRPELLTIASRFLGDNVDLYWNQSVYKMPEGLQEFPWHQDDGYTPVSPSPYLTLWIAINDATRENGCISALPGSHLRGLMPHERTPIGLACHAPDDPDQGVQAPVRAGSIAVFWSLTAHKSGVNRSIGVRKAYIVQYANAGLKSLATGEPITAVTPMVRDGQPVTG